MHSTFAPPSPLPAHALAHFARPGIVGVTGHRLDRLTPHHSQALSTLCAELFADSHSDCQLLTCMAEGTDTVVAEAWPHDRKLLGLLPKNTDHWRDTMALVMDPARFDQLRARAEITSLGQKDDVDWSALAKALVQRADRIFAVWDGAVGRPGGTSSVVTAAKKAGKPVLHLRFMGTGYDWA